MSFVSQTTSPSTPGTLIGDMIGDIHLSRAILEGLHTEIHNPELSRQKPPWETAGLLFGTADADSVWLETFEPVPVRPGDFLGAGERLQKALGDRISAIRAGTVKGPALLGWYVSRSDNHPGMLDRDVAIHNALFQNHHEVAVVWKREAKGHFALEIYAAKPGILLSKNNHRVASWRSANLTVLPEEVHVMPVDSGNNELFLNVYKTKSLEQPESIASWGRIRHYTGRLMPSFGKTAREEQDDFLGASLIVPNVAVPNLAGNSSAPTPQTSTLVAGSGPVLTTEATLRPDTVNGGSVRRAHTEEQSKMPERVPSAHPAVIPQEPLGLLQPEAGPALQTWIPPSLAAASVPQEKSTGFLRSAAWLLATIIISVLTYIAAHLYLKPMLLNLTGQAATGAVTASTKAASAQSSLGLKVGQNGRALELQWNPLYPPVQRALSGKLIINDGKATREIEIDGTQLRNGRIAYIPASSDVRFSFRVMNSQSDTITDSIRVLITPSETISSESRQDAGDRIPLSRGTKGRTIMVQPVAQPSPGLIQQGPATSLSRTSTLLSAVQDSQAAGSPEDASAPLIVKSALSMPPFRNIPGLASSQPLQAAPPKGLAQPSRQEATSEVRREDIPLGDHPPADLKVAPGPKNATGRTDGKTPLTPQPAGNRQVPGPSAVAPIEQRPFTPPIAVRRENPVLRPGILFSNVVVPVIVKINEAGKVTSAALAVPDNSIRLEISKEALKAAGKWRFSPAKIGDKAISSEMRINFVFRHSPTDGGTTTP